MRTTIVRHPKWTTGQAIGALIRATATMHAIETRRSPQTNMPRRTPRDCWNVPIQTNSPKVPMRSSTSFWRLGDMRLLLRPETKQHLTQLHIVRAIRQLDEAMALVPGRPRAAGPACRAVDSACGPADVDPKLGTAKSGQRRSRSTWIASASRTKSISSSSTRAATSSWSSGTRKRCRRCWISWTNRVHPARDIGTTANI